MKNIILCLIILFYGELLFSQKIILHRNSGGNQILYSSSIDSITFLPFVCGDEIRYEGKTYNTVLIGSQCWLKENLDIGTRINSNLNQTNNSTIEKYCYNDDPANCTTYGGMYQWNETMQYVTTQGAKGICPTGWHIPTLAEFQTLSSAVGGDANALKEIGQDETSTNTSGFSALLGGYRDNAGYFYNFGTATIFWSSTEGSAANANYLVLYGNDSVIYPYSSYKEGGSSVRCLKD